jgi:hypothetical protein
MTSPDGTCGAVAGGVPKVAAPHISTDDEGTSVEVMMGVAVVLRTVGDDEGTCVVGTMGVAVKVSSAGEEDGAPAEGIEGIAVEVNSVGDDPEQAVIKNIGSSVSITLRIFFGFILFASD